LCPLFLTLTAALLAPASDRFRRLHLLQGLFHFLLDILFVNTIAAAAGFFLFTLLFGFLFPGPGVFITPVFLPLPFFSPLGFAFVNFNFTYDLGAFQPPGPSAYNSLFFCFDFLILIRFLIFGIRFFRLLR